MRIKLPTGLSQKQLWDYLRDNERDLIEQKCSSLVYSEPVSYGVITPEKGIETKAMPDAVKAALLPDSIVVDAIANLSQWMDEYDDVSAPDSWKKTIQERGKKMVWLADHSWSIKNKIAKVLEVYSMDIDLKSLGIKSDIKTAQGLIFKGEFNPKYDECMYDKYAAGMVDQHSIGLQYIQIELGINDPDDKTHFKNWEKYYPSIINKNRADGRGYFWWIKEQKVFENSAVLFGANEMTPVIGIQTASSLQAGEPDGKSTQQEQPNYNQVAERLKTIFLT